MLFTSQGHQTFRPCFYSFIIPFAKHESLKIEAENRAKRTESKTRRCTTVGTCFVQAVRFVCTLKKLLVPDPMEAEIIIDQFIRGFQLLDILEIVDMVGLGKNVMALVG